MNAVEMIAQCMLFSDPTRYSEGDLGLALWSRDDTAWLAEKCSQAALPEEPMGNGQTSISEQVGETP